MLIRSYRYTCSLLLLFVAAGVGAQSQVPVYSYKVVAKYPHSTSSYTEGFFYRDGFFYEGTGLKGRSQLLVIRPETGKPVQQLSLPGQYFGEGIVDWGPNLYQWTWQSHAGFIYDRFSLRPIRRFTYTGEGWGMTRSEKEIITSDGTAILRFRDPSSFRELRHITVHDGSRPTQQLNELEYIKGEIYANIWHSDHIARISPQNGRVLGWIDLTGILAENQRIDSESVLNGIAYDAAHDRLFVTGKQWPYVLEIKIVPRPPMMVAR
jgi:glutamine cyclotransferase